MPVVFNHPCTLPQCDGCAGPAFAGGAERGDGKFVIFDAGNMLDGALAVGGPGIDAKVKMRSHLHRHRSLLQEKEAAIGGLLVKIPHVTARSFVEQLALPLRRSPSIATQAWGLWDC